MEKKEEGREEGKGEEVKGGGKERGGSKQIRRQDRVMSHTKVNSKHIRPYIISLNSRITRRAHIFY